ncbi:MAG: hypothetical protein ACRDSP_03625 [Pseudonocardiaceae bacterium]
MDHRQDDDLCYLNRVRAGWPAPGRHASIRSTRAETAGLGAAEQRARLGHNLVAGTVVPADVAAATVREGHGPRADTGQAGNGDGGARYRMRGKKVR